jgi:hypothetical protein
VIHKSSQKATNWAINLRHPFHSQKKLCLPFSVPLPHTQIKPESQKLGNASNDPTHRSMQPSLPKMGGVERLLVVTEPLRETAGRDC